MDTRIQTLVAWRTQRGCENLIASMLAMPEDKRNWKPMGTGRTVNDLLMECILVNLKWAATLRNRAYTRVGSEIAEPLRGISADSQSLIDHLNQSTAELIDAIRSVRDDELVEMIKTPFGSYSLADCCLIAYWNSVYHEGQINYIQTLYGDQARHTAF